MSSSKQSKISRIPTASKIIPRGSKLMNQSKLKRKGGVSGNLKISGSKVMESRFMSRMKSSMVGGKYGKSGYRKKGSSRYSAVRENGDPIIYRDGVDVTPLPIQLDNIPSDQMQGYPTYSVGKSNIQQSNCFIPLIVPICHPMSMSCTDNTDNTHTNVANDNNNNQAIICTDEEKEIDTITNLSEFNECVKNNASILDENIVIDLCETETQILFEMASLAVSNCETSKEEREDVIKMNKEYEVCLLKHSDKDLFTTSYTQTYNPPVKDQAICVKPAKTNEKHTQSSQFDIYDSFQQTVETQTTQITQNERINKLAMENSATFKQNMIKMERAIIQNVIAEKQILYRVHNTNDKQIGNEFDSDDDDIVEHTNNTKPVDDKNEESNEEKGANLKKEANNTNNIELLWTYSCSETESLSCTALDFNPLNTDLIVGGYGSWKFANRGNGKIMFWTLKNPTNPSRVYNISKTCVVSLNFSRVHPYLLGVGLYDGSVSVYDIRIKSNQAILKSELNSFGSNKKESDASSSSKHTTPVWNVLWERNNNNNQQKEEEATEKEKEKGEVLHQRHKLFSIASDGIIKQWSMKKGFISTNIMSLKRVSNIASKRGSIIDNTIRSRQASGLCFDFPLNLNNRQYYVGTEDGIIHKCSVSYNEQVLRTYYGHTGPIYRIQCSPFDTNKFISCSADWTINIWSQNKSKPLLQLISSNINQSIIDCCWSPFNSCIFASASENGILSIWNLQKNKKDPIITKNTKNPIKQIMFAPNAPALLSAHQNGNINVYRLNNINTQSSNNHIHQIDNLNNCFD